MPLERLKEYSDMVETGLDNLFPREACAHQQIFEACRYSLLAGGKHIRAALLLEFYRLGGGQPEDALPFACGLEMIHTYSLVHDDLPCMDDDDFRRGKPSSHKVYGETLATLAGDGLLNRAFEVMLTADTIPAERAVKAMAYMSRCSGVYGMIGGQVQDLAMEGKCATGEALREMVSLKTGALIRAACVCGVLLAGGDVHKQNAAEKYADAVGLAFQIRDDILDVTGDQATLGKAIGSDAVNDKTTFVTVYGLEACRDKVEELTKQAMTSAASFAEPDFINKLALWLAQRQN